MKKAVIVILLLVWGAWTAALAASPDAKMITVEEARRLVMELLEGEHLDVLSGFSLEREVSRYPRATNFYWFGASWAGTEEGSVVIGHYAVDKTNGNVWSATECKEFRSIALRKLQEIIKKRHGITENHTRDGPYCS